MKMVDDKISDTIDNKYFSLRLNTDLFKAFYTLDPNILLGKLEYYIWYTWHGLNVV